MSGEAISICRESATELALVDNCVFLNRLPLNNVRVEKIAEGFGICDLSTFGR
jgi:hypothetical protein